MTLLWVNSKRHHSEHKQMRKQQNSRGHEVEVTGKFLFCCVMCTIAFSFLLGRVCRYILLKPLLEDECGRQESKGGNSLSCFSVWEITSSPPVRITDEMDIRVHQRNTIHKRSMARDVSYVSRNNMACHLSDDRIVDLNGITNLHSKKEAAYHEALVHPALFAHDKPRRVALIDGWDGTSLREVLKHRTVEKVTMVGMNESVATVAGTKLRGECNDCSDLVGSADSCFDDPRVEFVYSDAVSWFLEKSSHRNGSKEGDMYDIIILDSRNLEKFVHSGFVRSIKNALREDGIFTTRIGEDDRIVNPPREYTKRKFDAALIQYLEDNAFEAVQVYSEARTGFLMALLDSESKVDWYANEAEVTLKLHERGMETKGGESLFHYFDGATMMSYQFPSRVNEEVHCRSNPLPDLCADGHGFDPTRNNVPSSALEVKQSSILHSGRGLFFKEDFQRGTYFAIDQTVNDMLIMPSTSELIFTKMLKASDKSVRQKWEIFYYYVWGYAFESDYYGAESISVDPGIATFINHGCNGSQNIGAARLGQSVSGALSPSVTEMTVSLKEIPEELRQLYRFESTVYSPFVDRNHMVYLHSDCTTRDVKAGDEVLSSYLEFLIDNEWEQGVLDLQAMCGSEKKQGTVSEYESATPRTTTE